MSHSDKTIERFKFIKEGSNIQEHMDLIPKHLKISKFYSRGNTMRLSMNKLSPTLVPGHSNFPIHPIEHRSITVRQVFHLIINLYEATRSDVNMWEMLFLLHFPKQLQESV